jgi:hypothetical protein
MNDNIIITNGNETGICKNCQGPTLPYALKRSNRGTFKDFCSKTCEGEFNWSKKSELMRISRLEAINPKASPQYHPDLTINGNLSYILGVLRSDGCVTESKTISLSSRDEIFAKNFSTYLNLIHLPSTTKTRFRKSSFNNSIESMYVTRVKSVLFSKWYKSLTEDQIREIALSFPTDYLRGFYEGDGIASSVGFCNSNTVKLQLARECLFKIGFEPGEYQKYLDPVERPELKNKKPMYRFSLGRISGRRFLELSNPSIKLEVLSCKQ